MSDKRTIEIPTLGRPIQLGMLYDCRSDTLIPGITLWDPDVLQRDRDVVSKHETQFDIISSDSIEKKTNVLNVEASIKASFLCGLVEVKGSAKYLLDKKTSSRQSRLSLQYKTIRRFEQLTMKQLGRGNVQHPHVFEQGTATHVVTGVLFGAQAFFVFDRNTSKDETSEDIQGKLKVLIEKIPSFSVEGEGNMHLDDREKKEVDMMQCKFYGDFAIEKNPTNYTDAVKVYGDLPSLLGKDGEHAVPMSVWLYPLSKLDSKAAQLVREISVNLISQTQGILEGLNQCQIKSEDMKSNFLCQEFPQFSEKLNVFKKLLIEYRTILQQKLARVLPTVRGGGSEETVLANVLSEYDQSPFCLHNLESWLKLKEKEMNVVKAYLKRFPDVPVVGARETLDELAMDPVKENLVCFSFPLIGQEDVYISQMSHYSQTASGKTQRVLKGWFDDVSTIKKMRAKANQFKHFADANAQSELTNFAVIGLDDGDEKATEGATIFLYEQGILTAKDYEPPGIPGTPVLLESLHDSVSLKWSSPTEGISGIDAYLINYRETQAGDNGWIEFRSETNDPEAIIFGLRPSVSYLFRVAAVSSIGVSKFSVVSPAYSTLPASPSSEKYAAKHFTTPENLLKSGDAAQGEPSIYRLPLSEGFSESEDKYRIYHFGKPENVGTQHRVIMLVGATGAGKSTLINGMINFIFQVDWGDAFRFNIIADEGENESGSQAESHTQHITSYTIHQSEHLPLRHTVTIIDTPGFDGASDIEKDKAIVEMIRAFFSNSAQHHVDHINAIGFVAQASQAGRVHTQRYMFDTILSIFGKDMKENIMLLLTFPGGQETPFTDAKIPYLGNILALFANNIDLTKDSARLPKSEEPEVSFDNMFWKMGMNSMGMFFSALDKAEPKSLTLTREVLVERKRLEVAIEGLQPEIRIGCRMLEERKLLEQHEREIEAQKVFSYKVVVAKLEQRYNKATGNKLTTESVIDKRIKEFQHVQQRVSPLISEGHQSTKRLEEIALKENPLSSVDYVDILIQSEKREAKPGWWERLQALKSIRKQADILAKIRQSDYNPFENDMN